MNNVATRNMFNRNNMERPKAMPVSLLGIFAGKAITEARKMAMGSAASQPFFTLTENAASDEMISPITMLE